jgi:hypothetical protein
LNCKKFSKNAGLRKVKKPWENKKDQKNAVKTERKPKNIKKNVLQWLWLWPSAHIPNIISKEGGEHFPDYSPTAIG